ncbi:MAG: DUF3048 domain-containing protein [Lachnospiraceae bacterium]|nr:DUF3048 domain-containing protein [Lachnospiraceae bacterium]
MKKKLLTSLMIVSLAAVLATGCGEKEPEVQEPEVSVTVEAIPEEPEPEEVVEEEPEEEEIVDELPEGYIRSELTNLPIPEEIKDQRPIAVMVDNESLALPHFGIGEADIVYELMNSTLNGRITRMMVMMKDWGSIEQMGSIRSARPTNFFLAAEWNACLVHDGGPFYIDQYIARDYCCHFSGGFSRVNNGKATEYTEYIMKGDLEEKFAASSYSTDYDEYYPGTHYTFALPTAPNVLSETYAGYTKPATSVEFPFPHNSSAIKYNPETGLYEYSEYGKEHRDGEDDELLTFTNVIIQKCTFSQLDDNGYLIFNILAENMPGYFLTGGEAVDITWSKLAETDITRYYDGTGQQITLNTGKTYIAIVPDDNWDELVMK